MSKRNDIYEFMKQKIYDLQCGSPWSKAALAKLRRGVGKDIENVPDTWEVVFEGIPEDFLIKGNGSGREIRAIFTSLCLYAVHQQSESGSVNVQGNSFATAVRSIVNKNNENAVKRRFDSLITSNDLSELSNHARGLVQIVKASGKSVGIDYPRFAQDLYDYQFESGRDHIRIKWGMDFYRVSEKTALPTNNNNEEKE